ncbi:MAG: nucleotide exchange factor GrpE [Thermoleophilia bacterium]|nr:nucleotide exchange factor GrpE [Thermoleophilia bacterium]
MTDRKHTTKDHKRTKAAKVEDAPQAAEAAETTEAAEEQIAEAAAQAIVDDLVVVARERDEYLDHLRRLKAEFENYRKRVQRDHEELRLRAAETVVESLLPVMDNMSRALEAGARHEEGQLLAGLELVSGQLRGTLEGHGLEEIPVEPGVLFDPTVHEAIMAQPSSDHSEGTVTQVLERGYLLHGRLLRPTKVIVAS